MNENGREPLQRDRRAGRRRPVQRLERTRLSERVLSPEEQLGLAADRVAQVLELQPVRVHVLELDLLDLSSPAQLDHRVQAVPGIVEEERALASDRLELVALRERGGAIEGGEHVAGKPQRAV